MRKKEKTELLSLNAELPSLYLEELEQRLETDPLAIGGLLSVDMADDSCSYCECNGHCGQKCNHCSYCVCNGHCGEYNE